MVTKSQNPNKTGERAETLIKTEEEDFNLFSKLSGVSLYNMFRVKEKETLDASHNLASFLSTQEKTLAIIKNISKLNEKLELEKSIVAEIRDSLGLKTLNEYETINIGTNDTIEMLYKDLGEQVKPLLKTLLEMSKKSYPKMDDKETRKAARMLQKHFKNKPELDDLMLSARNIMESLMLAEQRFSNFIRLYRRLTYESYPINIEKLVKNVLGFNDPILERITSNIISSSIAKDTIPSIPKVLVYRSNNGVDMQYKFSTETTCSYYTICYLNVKSYDEIAQIYLSIKEVLDSFNSNISQFSGTPKLSSILYSDLKVCLIGAKNFEASEYENVQNSINHFLSNLNNLI